MSEQISPHVVLRGNLSSVKDIAEHNEERTDRERERERERERVRRLGPTQSDGDRPVHSTAAAIWEENPKESRGPFLFGSIKVLFARSF